MNKLATLEFYGGNLSFSAGHFTIFSSIQREFLHGHNYRLEACVTAPLNEPGITFDYGIFRQKLAQLCRQLHSRFLLPQTSPYLTIQDIGDHYQVTFNHQYMLLLKQDVVLLPLSNITLEELSAWFINQLQQDQEFICQYDIQKIDIKVFNGLEHSSMRSWLVSDKMITDCC